MDLNHKNKHFGYLLDFNRQAFARMKISFGGAIPAYNVDYQIINREPLNGDLVKIALISQYTHANSNPWWPDEDIEYRSSTTVYEILVTNKNYQMRLQTSYPCDIFEIMPDTEATRILFGEQE